MEIDIKGLKVLIDDEDYELVMSHSWRIASKDAKTGHYYFNTNLHRINGKQQLTSLHRLLIGCVPNDGIKVDHINRNTLDNRKCNLRRATDAENSRNCGLSSRNTTGYKGVSHKDSGIGYCALIKMNGRDVCIGYSDNPIECAKMYDMMAIKLFKEFASTNFNIENYMSHEIEMIYNQAMRNTYWNNTSGYTGVSYSNRDSIWMAYINKNKKRYYLGRYPTPEEAALAYNIKAVELYGENAVLNVVSAKQEGQWKVAKVSE